MMTFKRLFTLYAMALLGGIALLPTIASATFTETLNAGYLYSTPYNFQNPASTTSGKLNNGALLLLVAAGTGNTQTFTATPAAGSYVGGGDTILGAASYSANLGTGGTNNMGGITSTFFGSLPSAPTGSSSIYIELRWYPSITYAQYMTGTVFPTAGTYFGAYNPLATNSSGNTTLNPDGDDAWIQQSSNSHTIDFYTTDLTAAPSHTQAVSEGYTNFLVPGAAVPEPSAGILVGLALVVLAGVQGVSRRMKVA